MTIHDHTLSLAGSIRVQMSASVDATTARLADAWVTAWAQIEPVWREALDTLATVRDDGGWPTRAQILAASQAQRALLVTRNALDDLAQRAGVTIIEAAKPLPAQSAVWEADLIASQMPPGGGPAAIVGAGFDRVSAQAIEAIVTRTTGQITSLLQPLSAGASAAIQQTLIQGVALGINPRTVAAEMLRRTQGLFNGGLDRAMRIARTEMLDAYRAAGRMQDKANPVVTGWVWSATLDERTCASCWSMNGTEHPVDETGPDDHVSGRCARVPQTMSWADLGFTDIPEPPSAVPDAQAVFTALPEASQLKIMGPGRLHLLQSGAVSWSDLAQRVSASGWRDSYVQRPVKGLAALAAQRRAA